MTIDQPQSARDLLHDPLSSLDELDSKSLLDAIRALGPEIPEPVAERLDRLFSVRCARLLRSTVEPTRHLEAFEELIARVANDRRAATLDAMQRRYFSRWSALRSVVADALRIDELGTTQEASARVDGTTDAGWKFVARLVMRHAQEGILWSEIAQALEKEGVGPRSKSGVSLLLSSMRNARWLESVAQGRTKRMFPGPLLKSEASDRSTDSAPVGPNQHVATAANGMSALVRKAVCLNQGKLIEFDRLSYLKHSNMRNALSDLLGRPAQHSTHGRALNQLRSKLVSSLEELDGFLQGTFGGVAQKNFALLMEYFATRSSTPPRVCIKANWQSREHDNQDVIMAVLRDADVSEDRPALISENTAFKHVIEKGQGCIINDIPSETVKGIYKNPRLDYAAVGELMDSVKQSPNGQFELTHSQWLGCWADRDRAVDPRQFYRSTLVVPMTLRNNSLSEEFRSSFDEILHSRGGSRVAYDRTFVGFLCIDHVDSQFFDLKADMDVAYVFADLLSIYIFKWLGLTSLSHTHNQARVEIGAGMVNKHRRAAGAAQSYFENEVDFHGEALELTSARRTKMVVFGRLDKSDTTRTSNMTIREPLTLSIAKEPPR